MGTENIKINDSFIVNALRNCGYTNYTAIADIIDNSLEPEVNSTFVKVEFETEGKTCNNTIIKTISIIDNGVGMEKDILQEAMTLGSETGKNGAYNLGMYGAGLKTASFSIGQKLEVFTKTTDENVINYAMINLEDTINKGENISVVFQTFNSDTEIYSNFIKKVDGENGTIVKISILDKLTNKNYYNFKEILEKKLSEIFNKFIYSKNVKMYVGKEELYYIDLMGNSIENELLGEGQFIIDNNTISYKAYFLPKDYPFDKDNNIITNIDGNNYLGRSLSKQGLYLYRQNRLVGGGLTLGLWSRDGWHNGFRCEIYFDGKCDSLFGSTFTKMIGETNKDYISQSLIDKLSAEILPYKEEVVRREKRRAKNEKENDKEEMKKTEDFYKRVTEKQNKNMMLRVKRNGENKPKKEKENEKEPQVRGPQKNPNPIKERNNKWLDGFIERPEGATAQMYGMEYSNGKKIIVINTDHPFYQKFYSKLDDELKFTMAQVISCEEIGKQQSNYYYDENVKGIINTYNDIVSLEVYKSLNF